MVETSTVIYSEEDQEDSPQEKASETEPNSGVVSEKPDSEDVVITVDDTNTPTRDSGERNEIPQEKNTKTPPEALYLTEEQTQKLIDQVRDVVEKDVFLKKIRKYIQTQFPQLQVKTIDGESFIVVYRSIQPDFDVAATASGMTNRVGSERDLRNRVEELQNYHQQKNAIETNVELTDEQKKAALSTLGREWFGKAALGHLVESDGSLFVPASTAQYASNFYKDGTFLELTVPLEKTVPIYFFADMAPQFKDEQEIAVAGRIEPEWIQILTIEEKQQAVAEEQERLIQYQQKQAEEFENSLPINEKLVEKLYVYMKERIQRIFDVTQVDILSEKAEESKYALVDSFHGNRQDGRFFLSNILTPEEVQQVFADELGRITPETTFTAAIPKIEKQLYGGISVATQLKKIDENWEPVWTSFLITDKHFRGLIDQAFIELRSEKKAH